MLNHSAITWKIADKESCLSPLSSALNASQEQELNTHYLRCLLQGCCRMYVCTCMYTYLSESLKASTMR